jgi:two-component system OmpR family sensor kinase
VAPAVPAAREPFAREGGGPGWPRRPASPRAPTARDEPLIFGDFKLGVRQSDGRWLVVEPKPTFRFDSWQQRSC